MRWITAAVASLLASVVCAAPGSRSRGLLNPMRPSLEKRMEEMAYGALGRRQTAGADGDLNAGGINMTQWENTTLSACISTLSTLPAATNPSGMAICYNLVQLDTDNGTFMADLRLFQVSPPTGDFEDVAPQQMKGGLSFNGATGREINGQQLKARGLADGSLFKRQQSSGPTFLRTYMIIGRINSDKWQPPMTMAKIEPLVMPIFTLTATNAVGRTVRTSVSSNEAAFVSGVFSKEVVLSPFSLASLAVQNATAELKAGRAAFVLPGVNLLIFPVGLVITGIWTAAGVGVYAFGTYERYQFRESYRRRKALASSKSFAVRI
ncbi:hypothetical protein F5Y17DRAFT_271961 [Xylariaceae sp. FL0594]|nr:hypothetical protein F5Y17DRAFT_271961 [Xylariaceae sp. FL0594]